MGKLEGRKDKLNAEIETGENLGWRKGKEQAGLRMGGQSEEKRREMGNRGGFWSGQDRWAGREKED